MSQKVEVIDLTNEANTTITIDDSVLVLDDGDDDAASKKALLKEDDPGSSENLFTISEHETSSESLLGCSDVDLAPSEDDEPVFASQPRLAPTLSSSPPPPIATNSKAQQKEAKRLENEAKRLESEANRLNAANKALDNCTAHIEKGIPNLINDPDELSIKTLFDESMVKYRLTESAAIENSITWTYKRTEIADGACVARYKDAPWIIIIMTGSEYLSKLMVYKQDPNSEGSIKTYLEEVRERSQMDVILIVINLSNYLKDQRTKEAKNYRKTFKDRFEGSSESESAQTETATANVTSLGVTELQDLRLMLEMNFKQEHSDWHLHVDFYEKTVDVVQAIIRYSLAVAKLEVKLRAKTSTGLDWAINMDKEKSVDPTKSSEELTRLWITQLQQFAQVTLPIAKAIASEYPSPYALLSQYEELSQSEAEDLLAELRVQKNLRRQIGSSISKRIHCLMTCKDPNVHVGLS